MHGTMWQLEASAAVPCRVVCQADDSIVLRLRMTQCSNVWDRAWVAGRGTGVAPCSPAVTVGRMCDRHFVFASVALFASELYVLLACMYVLLAAGCRQLQLTTATATATTATTAATTSLIARRSIKTAYAKNVQRFLCFLLFCRVFIAMNVNNKAMAIKVQTAVDQ